MGALLAAYFTRTQLLVLWATLPAALVAQELRFPRARVDRPTRRLRGLVARHWFVFALGVVIVIAGVVDNKLFVGDARGGAPLGIDSLTYGREMLAYVVVGVGMLPLALGGAWILGTLAAPMSAERHAFAVIALTAGALLTVIIGGGTRLDIPSDALTINDRYLLYLVPLMAIAMLALLLEPRRLTLTTVAAGALAGWMVWASQLKLAGPTFVTPTATYHPELNHYAERVADLLNLDHVTSGRLTGAVTLIATVVVALARRWLRLGAVAVVTTLLVGAYCVNETTYTRHRLTDIQPSADYARGRDWVDRALPRGTRAAVLLSSLGVDVQTAQATWWDVSFWNKKAAAFRFAFSSRVEWDGQAVPHPLTVDTAGGRIGGLGGLHYMLRGVADRRFGFVGETTVAAPHNNLQLWQLPAQQLRWWFHGLDETGYVPAGGQGFLRVFGDGRPGPRQVTIPFGTAFGATGPSQLSILHDGRPMAKGEAPVGEVSKTAVTVQLPAVGHTELVLRAGSTGVQFYGATVSAVG
jgi:hypothetical protein